MKIEQITKKLNNLSRRLDGIIGRLTVYRNIPEVGEAHTMALELGNDIDDLINKLL